MMSTAIHYSIKFVVFMHLINFSKHILIDLCRTFGALRSKRSHFVSFQMKKKKTIVEFWASIYSNNEYKNIIVICLTLTSKKLTTMHSYYFYVSDNFLLRQYYKRNKKRCIQTSQTNWRTDAFWIVIMYVKLGIDTIQKHTSPFKFKYIWNKIDALVHFGSFYTLLKL